MVRRRALVLALAVLLGWTGAAVAAAGAPYALCGGAPTGGGGASVSSAYRLEGHIVTVAGGLAQGRGYRLEGGFVPGSGAVVGAGRLALPLVHSD